MNFYEGRYHLTIPLQFTKNILPNNVVLKEIIHINVVLNSFMSSIKFGSNSHNMNVIKTLNNSQQNGNGNIDQTMNISPNHNIVIICKNRNRIQNEHKAKKSFAQFANLLKNHCHHHKNNGNNQNQIH